MQQAVSGKASLALKFSGLAVFVFGLVLAMPVLAATTTSLPVAEGNFHDWSLGAGLSKTSAVTTSDSDTSYISETSDNGGETFIVANAGIPTGATVNSVTINVVARTSTGIARIQLRVEKGTGSGNQSDDSEHNLTGSYSTYNRTLTTNPFTGLAWTETEVNAWTVRFGVQYQDDGSGNTGRVTQIYVVVDYTLPDTTAPVISSHDTVTVEATASNTPVTYDLPTATDNIDPVVVVSCSPASGTLFAVGTTPIVCNASDSAGNVAVSTTFNVVVQDTTAPVINSPAHGFAEATGPDGAVATYPDLYAVDAVDGTILTACSPLSGSVFPVGESHVMCNVSDLAGNSAIPMQVNVTVRDTTPPTITLIGDGIVLMNTGDEYVDLGATAVDLVDGDVTAGIVVDSSAINNMVPGGYLVTYTAADSHANTSTLTRTVFVSDHSAPVFPFISDMTVEAASSAGAFVTLLDVYAEDDVDGTILATCSFPSVIPVPFLLGTTLVTCSAVDTAFNIGTGGFNVVVQDTTAPVIVITPDSQTIEATSALGAQASYAVTVTDSVDTGVGSSAVCAPESDSVFPIGATIVTCTAHDEMGNAVTSTATVIVRDSTAPELTPPADQTFEATGFMTTPVLVPAVATDLVDPAPVVTSSHTSFPLGTTLVLWQAMDASSNIHFGVFSNVIIVDTTAPVVTINGDVSVSLMVGDVYTELGASATDIHDTELAVTIGGDVVNTAVAGTYHVTYDAHDSSGNNAEQKVRTVVVSAIPSSSGGGSGGLGTTYVSPTPPSFGDTPITVGGGLGSTSTVTLTFDVTNASWMAISETPDFSGTSWMPYTTNTTFTFSASNTERKLYIKFRRINGGETKVQEVTVLLNSPSTLIQAVLGIKITRFSELLAKLKLGSRGPEVAELQALLKEAGLFPANQAITGYYGPITLAAANKAMAASKKAVLGVKIARVDELVAKLKVGSTGAEVAELQTLLKQAGYFPAAQTATGYYGPITNAAVKKYLAATK